MTVTQIPTGWLTTKRKAINVFGEPAYDVSAVTTALQRHSTFLYMQLRHAKTSEAKLLLIQELRETHEEIVWATGVSRGIVPDIYH